HLVGRMRPQRADAGHAVGRGAHAPDEVRSHYAVQADGSFEHDALMIDAR
ncbi:hypothetical protein LIG30_4353, partial [Burkholderia sp. lig30]